MMIQRVAWSNALALLLGCGGAPAPAAETPAAVAPPPAATVGPEADGAASPDAPSLAETATAELFAPEPAPPDAAEACPAIAFDPATAPSSVEGPMRLAELRALAGVLHGAGAALDALYCGGELQQQLPPSRVVGVELDRQGAWVRVVAEGGDDADAAFGWRLRMQPVDDGVALAPGASKRQATVDRMHRLARWLPDAPDTTGLYRTAESGLPDGWLLARLERGEAATVCVESPGHEVWCWADSGGPTVFGTPRLGDDDQRVALWVARAEGPPAEVDWRLIDGAAGTVCRGGRLRVDPRAPGASKAPKAPASCVPIAPAPAPQWFERARGLHIHRVEGEGVHGLDVRRQNTAEDGVYAELESDAPATLCLRADDTPWRCHGWIPPGWGAGHVSLLGVGPPVRDGTLWPVQVRESWIGSYTDLVATDTASLIFVRPVDGRWVEERHMRMDIGEWTRVRTWEGEVLHRHTTAWRYAPTVDESGVTLALVENERLDERRRAERKPRTKRSRFELPRRKRCERENGEWICEAADRGR